MGVLTNLSLFSGAGGLDLGAKFVGGFRTIGYVEFDRYAQAVLMSRIRDRRLDDAPIWNDITTFDAKPWRGLVDVISGGFPCQDVSVAGKQLGLFGSRSGLWFEFARVIREVGPRFVLVENVPGLLARGMGDVLGELSEAGFDAEWWTLCAADVGAPHLRERVWIVAYSKELAERTRFCARQSTYEWRRRSCDSRSANHNPNTDSRRREVERKPEHGDEQRTLGPLFDGLCEEGRGQGEDSNAIGERPQGIIEAGPTTKATHGPGDERDPRWWATEPNVGRVAHGVAFRVDRLRLCGNGVVPLQSAPAWRLIKELSGFGAP